MKMRAMFSVVVAAAAALMLLGGCSSSKDHGTSGGNPAAGQTANLVCPMSGKLVAVGATGTTRAYDGKTVGFCCPNCPAEWDKLPDADKKAKLDAAMEKQDSMVANAKCPVSGQAVSKAVPMRVFDGKIVGFCCGSCPTTWDNLSDADKKAKLETAMK